MHIENNICIGALRCIGGRYEKMAAKGELLMTVKFMPEVDVDMIVHHNERPAKTIVPTAKKETEEDEYPDCVWP